MSTMKAAYYTQQGRAREVLQVGDLPVAKPGPGEVRVRIHFSGVNPSDWKIRRGGFGRGLFAPIVIPHSDGSGIIDAVGLGVPNRVGERVWIWNGQWQRAFGTAAQYITLPSAQAVALPSTTTDQEGACLGVPALTALQALRLADIHSGSTVLVAGGAGAVGNYAIQIAKLRGARVISSVSTAEKGRHAREAGADEIIFYRDEDVAERVGALTNGNGVDTILEVDLARNASLYPQILRRHATVAIYGTSANEATLPGLWLMQNSIKLRPFLIYDVTMDDRESIVRQLTEYLVARKLRHTIARVLPVDQIATAHEMLEEGDVIGNVILDGRFL